jgi:hypothetical protein
MRVSTILDLGDRAAGSARATTTRARPQHIEHEHQVALIAWAYRVKLPAADDIEPGASIGDYLLAIPNGGKRNALEAARMKREGVKAGVSDLLLPIPRQDKAGLWLELKAPGNKPTPLQRDWTQRMTRAGYRAEWADSWLAAADVIADFVGVGSPMRTIDKLQQQVKK